jgi:para-nitrobenzyl esterase
MTPAPRAALLPLVALLACAAPTPPPQAPAAPAAGAPALLDRTWELVRIQFMDDTVLTPDDPSRYTLRLVPGGRAELRADCNRGAGGYALDGSALSFGPLATTRAACPPGSLSDRYLQQLGFVRSFVLKDGRLHLATMADGAILEFR